MTSFRKDIRRSFPCLFEDRGFEFVDLANDYGGNIIEAQSDTLRISFANDRADFFLDFAKVGERDRWIGFYEIIDRLKAGGQVHIGYKYSNKIGHVSRLLEKCFPEIQNFFSEDSGAMGPR